MDSPVIHMFNPWQRILISIILSIMITVGFFGNLMICITFCRGSILQKSSVNCLIVNLAIVDILQCVNLSFMLAAANNISWFRNDSLCQLNGFANGSFVAIPVLSLTLISVDRYEAIVKKSKRNIFSTRNTLLFILFVWFYPSVILIAPLLGWSQYKFRPGMLTCGL